MTTDISILDLPISFQNVFFTEIAENVLALQNVCEELLNSLLTAAIDLKPEVKEYAIDLVTSYPTWYGRYYKFVEDANSGEDFVLREYGDDHLDIMARFNFFVNQTACDRYHANGSWKQETNLLPFYDLFHHEYLNQGGDIESISDWFLRKVVANDTLASSTLREVLHAIYGDEVIFNDYERNKLSAWFTKIAYSANEVDDSECPDPLKDEEYSAMVTPYVTDSTTGETYQLAFEYSDEEEEQDDDEN